MKLNEPHKPLRLATVFSGIGAIEQALLKLNINYNIIFACDNGERNIKLTREQINKYKIDNNLSDEQFNDFIKNEYLKSGKNQMKESYFANYKIDETNWYDDIRFIDGHKYAGKVDLFVGGSPCQSFSIIGKRAGLEDARGTLFYEYARLVREIQPKAFIYENVPGMLQHDKGNTWKVISEVFDSLGYKISKCILNAKNYGIPQDRKRLFVVGFRNSKIEFSFPKEMELKTTMFDYLDKDVDTKYYLGKKGFEFVTGEKYKNRARVNKPIIQTEKANQQFNWNGDFYFQSVDLISNKEIFKRAYIGTFEQQKGVIRQLTPRECLRLMGFSDNFKIVVTNNWAYRQAGNSIVVNVLQEILKQVFKAYKDIEPAKINVATVFSGIGSFEFALRRLNIDHNIIFACDNGERDVSYNKQEEFKIIKSLASPKEKHDYVENLYSKLTRCQNFVEKSYIENYMIEKDSFYQDIMLLDGSDYKNQVDIFVGGSPCQSFSSVGQQGGLEDARGTLFYEYARLIKELNPKVFIYENVRNLINHDGKRTWKKIKEIFDSLGYHFNFAVLNASDYGIPQSRRRLFVVGYKKDLDFKFPSPVGHFSYIMKDFCIDNCKFGNFLFDKKGNLSIKKSKGIVEDNYFLSEKVYKYVMKSGTKTWHQKPKINMDIARTLLKTMGNHHRAGVDNYISFDGKSDYGSVRSLTEREALRLMGFTDDFKIVVSKGQIYKQAGNSIVVDVLMAIIKKILELGLIE